METIPRNIILDLLPVYIAGEASRETCDLVERYAQNDPEIAQLIRTGNLESSEVSSKMALPDDLEMKTMKHVRRSIRLQMLYVAIGTASILLIPFIAMIFTKEVNWSLFDFIVMAVLLFSTGLMYVFVSSASNSASYKVASGIAAAAGFLLIWVNLAVGIIGTENNPVNLLYFGVLAVGIIGAAIARFHARGMAISLFAAAAAQMLVPVIALILQRHLLNEPPGITGVFLLNAFFAALFVISGLLFKRAARKS